MNSVIALFTALVLWLNPGLSDTRYFTKYKISSDSNTFTTTSNCSTYADVTNLSISFKTNGAPVHLAIVAGDGSAGGCNFQNNNAAGVGGIRFTRGGTQVGAAVSFGSGAASAASVSFPCTGHYVDSPSAGTYTYKVQACASAGTTTINEAALVVYDM